jgi:hypothetical protein
MTKKIHGCISNLPDKINQATPPKKNRLFPYGRNDKEIAWLWQQPA